MDTWTNTEKQIASALQETLGDWTPDCVDPDDLIGLIEEGGKYPRADALMAHITGCAYCRNAYREMGATLTTAAEARAWQTTHQSDLARAGQAEAKAAPAGDPAPVPQIAVPPRRPSLWQRLTGPSIGFAFAAAAAAVLYLAMVVPRLERERAEKREALVERVQANLQLAESLQKRDDLRHQVESLQKQAASGQQAQQTLEAQNRELQATADQLRWQLNTPDRLLARADQGSLRLPDALPGLDRHVLRSDPGEVEIRLVSPSADRLLTARPTLRWKALDAEVRYQVRILDMQNRTVIEGKTARAEWTADRDLPRGMKVRWQVEANRLDNGETVARSALATFLIVDANEAQELLRAKLALGARLLEAGLLSEAEREVGSVLDADSENRAARRLLTQIGQAKRGK